MEYGDNLTFGEKLKNLPKIYIGTGWQYGKQFIDEFIREQEQEQKLKYFDSVFQIEEEDEMNYIDLIKDHNKELREMIIRTLENDKGCIDDICIDHSIDKGRTISCKLTIPEDSEIRGGWTRPPKRISYEDYCNGMYSYNDWVRTMKTYNTINKDKIKKVIFNDPATIVFWGDGTKTVVKCNKDEFDPEKGLAMAIAKHFMGTSKSKGNYYNVFEKWIPKEEELPELLLPQEPIEVTIKKALNNTLDNLSFEFKLEETDSNATDNGGN